MGFCPSIAARGLSAALEADKLAGRGALSRRHNVNRPNGYAMPAARAAAGACLLLAVQVAIAQAVIRDR